MRTILLATASACVALCGAMAPASAAPAAAKAAAPAAKAAAPAGAAPKVAFKKHVSTGWTASVPANWTLESKRKYGSRLEIGRHTFHSPTKNLQFSISIREDTGKPMAKLAEAGVKRLEQKLMNAKITKKDVSGEHYLLIAEGSMLRGEFMLPYFVARVAEREPKDKTIVTLSLSGTAKRLDRFAMIFDKLINSFERRFPKAAVAQAAPVKAATAKPTSKPVKGR